MTYDVWPEGRCRDNSVITVSKYSPKELCSGDSGRGGVFDVVAVPVCPT